MKHLIRNASLAIAFALPATAFAHDGRIYPADDHYLTLPPSWYSYTHVRVGAAYAYARETPDVEADGIAPTLEFTAPFGHASRLFVSGSAFATILKDVNRVDFDYYNGHLAIGVHEPFTPYFDAALEVGPGYRRQAEDGAFGPNEESGIVLFARAMAYIKLGSSIDLRLAGGTLGDPFGDASLDFRITRGFSIAPTAIYRHIGEQDLWAWGLTFGWHLHTKESPWR